MYIGDSIADSVDVNSQEWLFYISRHILLLSFFMGRISGNRLLFSPLVLVLAHRNGIE